MKILEIKQNSPEWHQARAGRVGGSECSSFFTYANKPEAIPAGLKTLAYQKVAEALGYTEEGYESEAMLWGKEYEPVARLAFEDRHFIKVEEIGYVQEGKLFGFSPDGYLQDGTIIEIKCPSVKAWVEFASTKEIPKEHKAQMFWGMVMMGCTKSKYLVFHPSLGLLEQDLSIDEPTIGLVNKRKQQYELIFNHTLASVKEAIKKHGNKD